MFFAVNQICVLRGTASTPGAVGFMNNAVADVEIMPVVVSSIFSLIPSPSSHFFGGKKEALVMLDQSNTGESWQNMRDGRRAVEK